MNKYLLLLSCCFFITIWSMEKRDYSTQELIEQAQKYITMYQEYFGPEQAPLIDWKDKDIALVLGVKKAKLLNQIKPRLELLKQHQTFNRNMIPSKKIDELMDIFTKLPQ